MWCIPCLDDEFVERMEELLTLYEKPLNSLEPVVCLDEKPVQCLDDKRRTVRVRNGSYRRDYEYIRRGTANVFCAVEPKAGRHFTKVTPNRKKPAFARMLRDLTRAYPSARTIHLVMDNLSTHTKTALVETFGEEVGNELWSRFTVHYTPKHGSWLDQAEIEISLYSRQCLGQRRIGSIAELRTQTAAWKRSVNRQRLTIDWRFSVADARKKFRYSRKRGKIQWSGD
jgi:transposase